MPATKDRTGLRYGRLVVIERAPNVTTGGRSRVAWRCKCDCGKEIIVTGDNLQNGSTKSCGCLNTDTRQQLGLNNKQSLVGKTFGDLTVIKDCNETIQTGKQGRGRVHLYLCKCKCGNVIKIRDCNLRSGNTQSCGCNRESHGERKIKDLLSQAGFSFTQEKTFDSCRFRDTNALARFDFFVNNTYLIEFDGAQHFTPHNFGAGGEEQMKMFATIQDHDAFKNQWCKKHNIPLIRIPYTQLKDLTIQDLLLETSRFIV